MTFLQPTIKCFVCVTFWVFIGGEVSRGDVCSQCNGPTPSSLEYNDNLRDRKIRGKVLGLV